MYYSKLHPNSLKRKKHPAKLSQNGPVDLFMFLGTAHSIISPFEFYLIRAKKEKLKKKNYIASLLTD